MHQLSLTRFAMSLSPVSPRSAITVLPRLIKENGSADMFIPTGFQDVITLMNVNLSIFTFLLLLLRCCSLVVRST